MPREQVPAGKKLRAISPQMFGSIANRLALVKVRWAGSPANSILELRFVLYAVETAL
jgi:hypothetical protein